MESDIGTQKWWPEQAAIEDEATKARHAAADARNAAIRHRRRLKNQLCCIGVVVCFIVLGMVMISSGNKNLALDHRVNIAIAVCGGIGIGFLVAALVVATRGPGRAPVNPEYAHALSTKADPDEPAPRRWPVTWPRPSALDEPTTNVRPRPPRLQD